MPSRLHSDSLNGSIGPHDLYIQDLFFIAQTEVCLGMAATAVPCSTCDQCAFHPSVAGLDAHPRPDGMGVGRGLGSMRLPIVVILVLSGFCPRNSDPRVAAIRLAATFATSMTGSSRWASRRCAFSWKPPVQYPPHGAA